MEGFKNGGQIPAYGNEKTREQVLIQEFKALRMLQKSYFKSRYDDPSKSADLLTQSKIQEKKVDQMIEEYYKPKNMLF